MENLERGGDAFQVQDEEVVEEEKEEEEGGAKWTEKAIFQKR